MFSNKLKEGFFDVGNKNSTEGWIALDYSNVFCLLLRNKQYVFISLDF